MILSITQALLQEFNIPQASLQVHCGSVLGTCSSLFAGNHRSGWAVTLSDAVISFSS